jgi:hypothetical protein
MFEEVKDEYDFKEEYDFEEKSKDYLEQYRYMLQKYQLALFKESQVGFHNLTFRNQS